MARTEQNRSIATSGDVHKLRWETRFHISIERERNFSLMNTYISSLHSDPPRLSFEGRPGRAAASVYGSDHEGELVGRRPQIQRVCEGGDVGDHECADLGGRSNWRYHCFLV